MKKVFKTRISGFKAKPGGKHYIIDFNRNTQELELCENCSALDVANVISVFKLSVLIKVTDADLTEQDS